MPWSGVKWKFISPMVALIPVPVVMGGPCNPLCPPTPHHLSLELCEKLWLCSLPSFSSCSNPFFHIAARTVFLEHDSSYVPSLLNVLFWCPQFTQVSLVARTKSVTAYAYARYCQSLDPQIQEELEDSHQRAVWGRGWKLEESFSPLPPSIHHPVVDTGER